MISPENSYSIYKELETLRADNRELRVILKQQHSAIASLKSHIEGLKSVLFTIKYENNVLLKANQDLMDTNDDLEAELTFLRMVGQQAYQLQTGDMKTPILFKPNSRKIDCGNDR